MKRQRKEGVGAPEILRGMNRNMLTHPEVWEDPSANQGQGQNKSDALITWKVNRQKCTVSKECSSCLQQVCPLFLHVLAGPGTGLQSPGPKREAAKACGKLAPETDVACTVPLLPFTGTALLSLNTALSVAQQDSVPRRLCFWSHT